MNRQGRRTIIARADKLMARYFPGIPRQGACLYYAWAVCQAAREEGHRFLLQAGTAFWPRMTLAQDDGVSPLCFGYQWDPVAAQGYLARQMMPEMHCWVGDPAEGEVIDLTTGYWPVECKRIIGLDWPGPRPPDHVWASPLTLPDGVRYEPDREAGLVARRLLEAKFVWKGKGA